MSSRYSRHVVLTGLHEGQGPQVQKNIFVLSPNLAGHNSNVHKSTRDLNINDV